MERADNLYRQDARQGHDAIGDTGHATTTKARAKAVPRTAPPAAEPGRLPARKIFHQDRLHPSRREQLWVLCAAAIGVAGGIGFIVYDNMPTTATVRSAIVPVGGVTCWSDPGVNSSVVETISEGEAIRTSGNRNGWTQVLDKGCWAKESQLIFT